MPFFFCFRVWICWNWLHTWEKKATILWWEGLGWIKIALAGTDTSSHLDILQAHNGHSYLIESNDEGGDVSTQEGSGDEGAADKVQAGKVKEMSTLASAGLVFPFKSTPLVIAGIPKNYLPLHGL